MQREMAAQRCRSGGWRDRVPHRHQSGDIIKEHDITAMASMSRHGSALAEPRDLRSPRRTRPQVRESRISA
jgi:hypothetical protein